MNQVDFDVIQKDIGTKVKSTLSNKREEYADDYDVLQNFKRAAQIQQVEPSEALAGMMVKHTISIYDMVSKGDPTRFTEEHWDEKIVDHINYLILLKATVLDAMDNLKD